MLRAEAHGFLELEISLDPVPNAATPQIIAEGDESSDPGPQTLDWHRKVAAMNQSLLNVGLQTGSYMTSSCRKVEGTRVPVELRIAPEHLDKVWEVIRIIQSASRRAMSCDHCDPTFQRLLKNARVGEFRVHYGHRMLSSRVR